jgi:hypothetical protein
LSRYSSGCDAERSGRGAGVSLREEARACFGYVGAGLGITIGRGSQIGVGGIDARLEFIERRVVICTPPVSTIDLIRRSGRLPRTRLLVIVGNIDDRFAVFGCELAPGQCGERERDGSGAQFHGVAATAGVGDFGLTSGAVSLG